MIFAFDKEFDSFDKYSCSTLQMVKERVHPAVTKETGGMIINHEDYPAI